MLDVITYNQILYFSSNALICKTVVKSYVDQGKLILILEDLDKIIIDGKKVDSTGHKKRIEELITMAIKKEFSIDEKSVKHYATDEKGENIIEYVLIRR